MTSAEQIAQLTHQNQAIVAENAILSARCEEYAKAHEYLQEQILDLRRRMFGTKSERYIDPENKQQSLFDNASLSEIESSIKSEESTEVASYSRKKSNPDSNKALPRRIEIIPLSEADKQCSCGLCKTIIRYETKELLHYKPAVMEILEQRREVGVCPNGCDGSVVIAPAPLHILPKVKATAEFLSYLIVNKLDDRQPLYHLEQQLHCKYGVECSRQTMARWMIDLMEPLRPIYNLLKDQIIEYDVSSCDATTLQVLNEPGRKAETKSYAYCIRGGPPDKSVILYDYNATEHKHFVHDWFSGFAGYLHVDGDNFIDLVGSDNAIIVNCNAHARRKFEPIAKSNKGSGVAKQAMRYFKDLYKVEREAKDNHLTPEQRYQLRLDKSKPILDEFNAWIDKVQPTVLPKSALGLAIQYCINHRAGLMRFLADGRLEIDNNLTEQAIKPLVIARKNFLFCSSVGGANALCMHFGIIRTAKAHGLDPYHYYVMLLKNVPHCTTVEDYEKLLPWNIGHDYMPKLIPL